MHQVRILFCSFIDDKDDDEHSAKLEILRILAPLVPDEPLLQPDGAGKTPIDLAEENGTEAALECAGYIYGVLSSRERDRGRTALEGAATNGVNGLEADMEDATLDDDDDERETTPTATGSSDRPVSVNGRPEG